MNPFKSFEAFNQFILLNPDKSPFGVGIGELYDNPQKSWMSLKEAASKKKLYNNKQLGFVFTQRSGLFFIDLDNCVANNQWTAQTAEIASLFHGCYQEISISGTGIHIIGTLPAQVLPPYRNKNSKAGIEFYIDRRYVALTGNNAIGNINTVGYNVVELLRRYLLKSEIKEEKTYDLDEKDKALLEKMLSHQTVKNVLSENSASFKDLWERDEKKLALSYPSKNVTKIFDWSEADLALCSKLAFWTGKNFNRIKTLFEQSSLMRDKWLRDDYSSATINKAINGCEKVYLDTDVLTLPTGTLIQGDLVYRLFDGIVYDTEDNNFYLPNFTKMNITGFGNSAYAQYNYIIDAAHGKGKAQITGDPVKAFTRNKLYDLPKVHGTIFDPSKPSWTIITNKKGLKQFNAYYPPDIRPEEGDVSWYHDYLKKMCTNKADRELINTYCISLVQNPGIKFQWCIGLQGYQGIGKGAIVDILEQMIGLRYTYRLRAINLRKEFNSWMYRKLLIEIAEFGEEISERYFPRIRDYITAKRVDVELKGKDGSMEDNLANFVISTNSKMALANLWRERRIAPISLAVQDAHDLIQRGLTSDYWLNLYKLIGTDKELITKSIKNLYYYFLNAIPNPDYDPLGKKCRGRAPETSFLEEAKYISLSREASKVLEAIDREQQGFRGGVIFLPALTRLFYPAKDLSVWEKTKILQELSYKPHPRFKNRFSVIVPEEGGVRPTVYIKENSHLKMIRDKELFQNTCLKLQGYTIK